MVYHSLLKNTDDFDTEDSPVIKYVSSVHTSSEGLKYPLRIAETRTSLQNPFSKLLWCMGIIALALKQRTDRYEYFNLTAQEWGLCFCWIWLKLLNQSSRTSDFPQSPHDDGSGTWFIKTVTFHNIIWLSTVFMKVHYQRVINLARDQSWSHLCYLILSIYQFTPWDKSISFLLHYV